MARDAERLERAQQTPIVGGLPNLPGIGTAMGLTEGLGLHLGGLADELLVHDYPGATISRADREVLAAAVSAANDCFFCMDAHAANAIAVMALTGETQQERSPESVKFGSADGFDHKMQALMHIARTVGRGPLDLTAADVESAHAAGATDGDVQLAVLIAAGFSMYNRLVDGFRAATPPSTAVYSERARDIAANGYSHGLDPVDPSSSLGTAPCST